MSQALKQPYARIRKGLLTISIWRNEGEHGYMYHCSPIQRSYRDTEGNWQYTQSLNERDLLNGAKLLDQADTLIQTFRLEDAQRAAREAAERGKNTEAPPPAQMVNQNGNGRNQNHTANTAHQAATNANKNADPDDRYKTITLPDGTRQVVPARVAEYIESLEPAEPVTQYNETL